MNILSSLNSGFAAAANGTAEIYVRDTSTRATYYGDFEASTTISSGADVALDAYGSAEVYVNQLVDVVVRDEDGNVAKSYTDGYSSPNIEVISPAFTGTDYVTAAVAVNEPTTLQAVLNLWATNNGAPDWKVVIAGVATTLQNAFGATTGLVFNVKSPAYGAVGDGVTSDQTAIAAALAAAVAAGGGIVFFPKGTYLITTAIEWSHLVSIAGVGNGLSIITNNSSTNAKTLTWTSGSGGTMPQFIWGMSFTATQSNTGEQLYTTVAANIVCVDCQFNVSSNCANVAINWNGAGSRLVLVDCVVNINVNAYGVIWSSSSVASCLRTRFVPTGTGFNENMVQAGGVSVFTDCEFDATAVSSAPTILYGIEHTDGFCSVLGCRFLVNAQQFNACIRSVGSTAELCASGNDFGPSPAYSVAAPLSGTSTDLQLKSYARLSSAGAAQTIPNAIGLWEWKSTSTVPTVTMPAIYQAGQRLTVLIFNDSGLSWATNVTWTGAQLYGTTDTTAAAGEIIVAEFVASDIDTAAAFTWVAVSMKFGSA